MLSTMDEHLRKQNPTASLKMGGQEVNPSSYAVCKEHAQLGFQGRFGPGLPAVSDGSMLFLLHLISKMRDVDPRHEETRGRAAIVP